MRRPNPSVFKSATKHNRNRGWRQFVPSIIMTLTGALFLTLPMSPLLATAEDSALPFKATSIIIETTDNDIELQAFVDGGPVKKLQIYDRRERKIFNLNTQRKLGRQGLSELTFASEPDHFPEEALAPSDEANEVVQAFLKKFPAGVYEFEGKTVDGLELEGEATLTHVLPALPEIVAPISFTDDPPVVDPNNLVIEWNPVTIQFLNDNPVEIIEYQIILDQVEPLRTTSWIDGLARRGLINVPGNVTSLTVPSQYLLPGTLYDFEVLAIEASGNVTISVGEFMTME